MLVNQSLSNGHPYIPMEQIPSQHINDPSEMENMAGQEVKEWRISCAYRVNVWQLSAQESPEGFFGEWISYDKKSSVLSKQ